MSNVYQENIIIYTRKTYGNTVLKCIQFSEIIWVGLLKCTFHVMQWTNLRFHFKLILADNLNLIFINCTHD